MYHLFFYLLNLYWKLQLSTKVIGLSFRKYHSQLRGGDMTIETSTCKKIKKLNKPKEIARRNKTGLIQTRQNIRLTRIGLPRNVLTSSRRYWYASCASDSESNVTYQLLLCANSQLTNRGHVTPENMFATSYERGEVPSLSETSCKVCNMTKHRQ